jgi:hypothetical protein
MLPIVVAFMTGTHKRDGVAKSVFSTESLDYGLKKLTPFFRVRKEGIFPDIQYNESCSW